KSRKPVISVTAVRTGSGKSQITDYIAEFLTKIGVKYTVVRHPMPYGDLEKQRVQIFESLEDLDKYNTTIEEREEYEKHLVKGRTVIAGIEYSEILKEAEARSEIILWDGGNNDFSFFKPDLQITIVDPLRENHELLYYPGLTNLMTADIVVINKENTATKSQINNSVENIKIMNPKAKIVHTDSLVQLTEKIKPRTKVIIVEDGPTTTHGGMTYGAGYLAATKAKLRIVDPSPHAVGSIKRTLQQYPNVKEIIPAMGYFPKQLMDLKKTIEHSGADVAIIGTPIDLSKLLQLKVPSVRAEYSVKEKGNTLKREILKFARKI
ncbi:MAG: GTPase, partial [Candidatus Nanoarchaeia archaeon]|nr:GTPase [Candidatus Nanoarchaeia archaeon]